MHFQRLVRGDQYSDMVQMAAAGLASWSWGRRDQDVSIEMVFHDCSEWNVDMDNDEDDSMALHVSLRTKLSRFRKFKDENDLF
jgi:hypothetical protein